MSLFKKYVGTPYLHAGRDLNGLDCWGLIIAIYRDLGINIWDYKEFYAPSNEWDASVFLKAYILQNEWYPVKSFRTYDALLFKNMIGIGTHVGVVIDEFHFIHSARKIGTVITPISLWEDKIMGIYRHKAVDYGSSKSD